MRIVMTSDIVLNDEDTRANHLLQLFNSLSKISEVYLFASTDSKKKDDSYIKYVRKYKIGYLGLFFYEISYFIKLLCFCHHIKADVIYHRQSGLNIAPICISRLLGIVFFVEVNGLLVEQAKMKSDTYNISKFQLTIANYSAKINYKLSDGIIAVAEGIKQGLIKLYNIPSEKVVVIQNGANTDLFHPINKKDILEVLSFSERFKYIGFVGSFAPWHGLEHLVNSAPLVLSKYPNVKFILIGDGGLKNKIKKMINDLNLNDNFVFVGRVPHLEVARYINLFDICIIFKDKDIPGSPLKLAEYMACGKPVIATNSEDFEILKKNNAGILVDPGNSEEVSHAIITLLKNDSLRENMGNAALMYIIANRTWENTAKGIISEIKYHL